MAFHNLYLLDCARIRESCDISPWKNQERRSQGKQKNMIKYQVETRDGNGVFFVFFGKFYGID